jgi:restriction endonuclease S subunit
VQYSIVKKRVLNEEFRIDAEYYSPENLIKENAIIKHNHKLLGDICDLIAGPFGSTVTTERYDANSNKRYIRGKDIQSFFIEKTDAVFIENNLFHELPQFHLKAEDILVTVVGMKFGKSAIIYPEDCPAVFSCKSTLIRNPSINVWYLLTYLSSNIGYGLMRRGQRGAAQPGINLFDIKNIPVPIYCDNFQLRIEALVKQSKSFVTASNAVFSHAQTSLLSELNLINWQPKHQLSFVKNYSDTELTGRFDAEYYQPKYDKIVKAIKSYSGGWDTLGNLCKLVGHPSNPPYADTEKTEKTFIVAQNDLGDYSLSDTYWSGDDAKYTTSEFVRENQQYILRKNDLVLYTVGAAPHIGKANIVFDENVQSTIGSFVTLVRANTEKINPFSLLALFNSPIGYLLTNRFQRGMVQQYIYPKDLIQTPIPILPKEVQTQIQQKITESFNLRKQSKHLLECAKKAVEIAIEQDEQTATKWLENETKEMQT